MKKMFFQFTSVYAFSLIIAILLLIFKSRIPEGDYLVTRLLLFGCSVLTGALLFTPRFIVWLTKKIFKNAAVNPEDFPEGYAYWWTVTIVLFLSAFFNMTLIIPITIIIQSSYLLYRIAKGDESLILANSQE